MPLATGQVLNNRYRIVKLLGQGGFGAVYRAWDTSVNAPCALKENYDVSPEAARQFAKEASLLANLRHHNLPKVMDHFSLPGQGQYLVMEYIEGQDLQEMLDQAGGPLPEAQALAWIGQVCDALSYLHSRTQPIIHRDLKPANIRITPEGQAVLVDFGIAKVYDPAKRTSTAARAVTPGYAPFEQYGQRPTDARTDIYALGATLYHLLTGQKPPDSVDRIPADCLLAPRRINPAISAQVEAAVLKAMQIDPDKRWQSAAEFKKAISGQPSAVSRPQAVGSVQSTVNSGQAAAQPIPQSQIPNLQSKIKNLNWLFALAGVILVAIILWALFGRGGGGAADDFPATQTALAEISAQATADTRPTRAPTDAPAAAWTAGPTEEMPSPTETPLPTEPPPPTATAAAGGVEMVLIPAGEFLMGSTDSDSNALDEEKPQHRVTLGEYSIDVYEVTNALFEQFVQATGHQTTAEKEDWGYAVVDGSWQQVSGADWRHPQGPSSSLDGLGDHPVVQVSWEDAAAYCEWRGARLPTEAEWEKAARGTDGRIYPWGDTLDGSRVNFCDKNCPFSWADKNADDGYAFTAPVGSYPAGVSPYGLYDMAGNVWEWVSDWYQDTFYNSSPSENPSGPSSGEYRVLRGGSWGDGASVLRAADRYRFAPSDRVDNFGFRCSRSP